MLTPDAFFGRAEDVAALRRIILEEQARCVVLHAMPGKGKSALAAVFTVGEGDMGQQKHDLPLVYRHGVQDEFDYVLWWRLTDAPPLLTLASEIFSMLGEDLPTELPEDSEKLCSMIFHALAGRSLLLILDNLESLLASKGNESVWREGYENYRTFLRQACETGEKTTLLITTREIPRIILEQSQREGGVYVVRLTGLETIAFGKVFAAAGEFESTEDTLDWLTVRYDGNPLAARILGNYIRDVYGGSVEEFRRNEPEVVPEFDDLLDHHFRRLSGAEKEVAYWLAINRAPVSVDILKDDMLLPQSRERLSANLQSLSACIPLERNKLVFGLQPVLLEFITVRICVKVGSLFACSDREITAYVTRLLADDIAKEFQNGEFGLLDRVALLKAYSPQHVREAQHRSLIRPLLERLESYAGSTASARTYLYQVLLIFQENASDRRSYVPANVASLLISLDGGLFKEDFSGLTFIRPYFAGTQLRNTKFVSSRFIKPVFTEKFGAGLAIDVSPCGRRVAAGDTLGLIRIWDLDEQQSIVSASSHRNWVRTLCYISEDRIASAGNDGDIVVVDAHTAKEVSRIDVAHKNWINTVEQDGHGGFISASEDGYVRRFSSKLETLWSLNLDALLFDILIDSLESVAYVAMSGGEMAVVKSVDGSVARKHHVLDGDIQALALSKTGTLVAAGDSNGEVAVMRRSDGAVIKRFDSKCSFVRCLIFFRDLLIAGGDDGVIRSFAISDPAQPTKLYTGHTAAVRGLKSLPDNKSFASVSEDKTVRRWDFRTGAILDQTIGHSATVWSAHQSRRGAVVGGLETGATVIWPPGDGSRLSINEHRGRIFSVRCHPTEEIFASGGADGVIRICTVSTGNVLRELAGHRDWIKRLRFSADGQRLYSCSEDRTVRAWDFETGHPIWTSEFMSGRVTALLVDGRMNVIFVGDEMGRIALLDVQTGQTTRKLKGHEGKVRSLVCSGRDKSLFSAGEDGVLRCWQLDEQDSAPNQYRVSSTQLWSLEVAPHCDVLTAGDNEGNLYTIDQKNGEIIERKRAHDAAIWDIQASSSGEYLALASGDEYVSLWSARPLVEISRWRAPQPYEGSDFRGADGLSEADRVNLRALGASA